MANTAQARKRARQGEVRRQHNASLKSSLRTALKKVKKAIAGGDKAAATKEFQSQQSVIDRIADKRIVHKNTASRNKTRLAQAIKALSFLLGRLSATLLLLQCACVVPRFLFAA